jgi:hypothetical protein
MRGRTIAVIWIGGLLVVGLWAFGSGFAGGFEPVDRCLPGPRDLHAAGDVKGAPAHWRAGVDCSYTFYDRSTAARGRLDGVARVEQRFVPATALDWALGLLVVIVLGSLPAGCAALIGRRRRKRDQARPQAGRAIDRPA